MHGRGDRERKEDDDRVEDEERDVEREQVRQWERDERASERMSEVLALPDGLALAREDAGSTAYGRKSQQELLYGDCSSGSAAENWNAVLIER